MRRESGLFYGATVIVRPGTPLISIDMTKVAILVGPFIPYPHTVVLQILYIRIPFQKPQQLMNNGA